MPRDFEELDFRPTDLGELTLRRRRVRLLDNLEVYEVKLGNDFLMSSLFHDVEEALADLCLKDLPPNKEGYEVTVGGLGLGYTAAAALRYDTVRTLLVIDYLQPVIHWHQTGLVPLGAGLTADNRCTLRQGDFFALAQNPELGFDLETPGRKFHAILLDIDHSPQNTLHPRHQSFYSETGLKALAEQLHPEGVFGLWSDDPPDAEFMATLRRVFATVESHIVTFYNPLLESDSSSTVYVAKTASP